MSEYTGSVSRLVLGTAQLGMPYGIANKIGKPDYASALSLVRTAWENGITEFDTAQVYGEGEQVLGRIFEELGVSSKAKVTTKLKLEQNSDKEALARRVQESLERLGVRKLECLLLHHEDMLDLLNDAVKETLQMLIQKGHVRHLGVSLYSPKRAKQALDSNLFHVMQLPASVLDRRFHRAGIFENAQEHGCCIYIRSVFLQGLLLMKMEEIPGKMAPVKPALAVLDRLASRDGLDRRAVALLYVRDKYPNAKVIFGAEAPEQVLQNIKCWRLKTPKRIFPELDNSLPGLGENILNPAKWRN